ncbi:hypothetical protein [Peribacillus deserti]|uniref:Uncharacterized protein n=1 Tax=Peribacillus deserti TaxID=673318 RepID=A0A2N5M2B9_9BACI|nr:hypothetical protein [Peribacillus deserti]PLT28509.1 hypothetical protein CUU66_18085 [Peribacillus deserti]
MAYHKYYHQTVRAVGRPVEIRTRRGTVHRGIIHRVTPHRLYIRPVSGNRGYGGFGYGYFGGYGWGGAAEAFAFGAITSIAFLAFFW